MNPPRPGAVPASIVRNRPPPARAPQSRRNGASGAVSVSDVDDNRLPESRDVEEERQVALEFANSISQERKDDGMSGGSTDEGKRRERHFAAVMHRGNDALRLPPGPSMPQALTLDSVAATMVKAATGARGALPGIDLQVQALRLARRWMSVAGQGDANVTLAAVRSSLVSSGGQMPVVAGPGTSIHLWLPAFLLNLHRPRTPQQQAQAEETLALLERVTGVGGTGSNKAGRGR